MSWTSILMALSLALGAAWLVFHAGWDTWIAMTLMAGVGFTLVVLLFGVIWFLAKPEDRPALWSGFSHGLRSALGAGRSRARH